MTQFYSLASSSSGNCSVFQGGGRTLLIDGGTNTKYIRNALSQLGIALGDITDVLITHTHSDHISALPVLTMTARAAAAFCWRPRRENWAIAPTWGICLPGCLKPCGEPRRCFWNPTTMYIS